MYMQQVKAFALHLLTFQFFFLTKKRSVARGPMVVATPAKNSNCRCKRPEMELTKATTALHLQLVRATYISHSQQASIEEDYDSKEAEKQTKGCKPHSNFCSSHRTCLSTKAAT